MNTVTVNASGSYDILIGEKLLFPCQLPEDFSAHPAIAAIRQLKGAKKAHIVTDDNVMNRYSAAVMDQLRFAGLDVSMEVFPAGEASKNCSNYVAILNSMAKHQLTRSDIVVALGGGVMGDLAGFAAATFLRGIRYVQIPTTLLAAVDSSVGGKTAIDLPAGKNLAGAFHQPSLVLCDTGALNTLPEDVFRDGCAEVIKYGVLYDPNLFAHLQQHGLNFHREEVITRCVELKRDVVMEDEFDTGARMKLNLGHTIGHGVEAASGYTVSHGKAVAIGMAIVARAACARGFCTPDCRDAIVKLLEQFHLPTTTEYSADVLYEYALSDKKRSGGTVNLIIPREIGSCTILPMEVENLKSFIQAGL